MTFLRRLFGHRDERADGSGGIGDPRGGADDRLRETGERLGMTLPPLLVAAERVAATVAQGVHGRRRTGQGETFWQFRGYRAGDDPATAIDWRQSAKGQRLFVRENEWEAAQSVWLWSDPSPSMRFRSSANLPTKGERAELLTLALTVLLSRAGEHVALIGQETGLTTGKVAVNRVAERLLRARDMKTGNGDVPPPMPLPRHAHTVWISDFLAPVETIDAAMRAYAARGVTGHMVQVLDPAEETLPYHGRVRFEGLEGEEPVTVSSVEALREAYSRRMMARQQCFADEARRVGWTFSMHRTDRPPQAILLTLHALLSGLAGGQAVAGSTAWRADHLGARTAES